MKINMFVSGNLIGGLGNQLFILSAVIEYGKKYNRKVVFTQLYSNPHCSCLLYTSPSPRDRTRSRMPSSA